MARRRDFGSIRRLPSRKYQASYWHEGRRHAAPRTFDTKADANAWLSTVQASILRGGWVDPDAGKTTLRQASARWLEANPLKRPSSLERDRLILSRHVLPALGDRPIASVSRPELQRLVNAWARDYAASSVGRMFSVLRALLSWAEASELIVRSPARGVKVPRASLVERPHLAAGELEAIAAALGDDYGPMVWLGAVLGLRWAEIAGLRVADIDLGAQNLSVRHQLARDGALVAPKSSAGRRQLAMPAWLAEELGALLGRKELRDAEALVFAAPGGGALNYGNWLRRRWQPACEAAGVAGLRFHDLRSMAATALVTAGVDVKTAQSRLGHSSPSVTLGIYARATTEADRKAADAVGRSLRPSRTDRARRPRRPQAPQRH